MTKLLQCLRDELVRRDYAATTIRSYIQIVDAFRQHTGARLDRITPAQLRRYHLFLLEERRLAIGTVVTQICALRFFCRYVLSVATCVRTCRIRRSGSAYRSCSVPTKCSASSPARRISITARCS